ncbi:MAG: radical SAM family heme chaperone HemW [Caulobacteraceae bacterium]
MTAPPIGLYVHWPYCARICPYCDFNVVRARGREAEAEALGEAILADLEAQAGRLPPRRLVSVFFGGGTPSLMPPALAAGVVAAARRLWPSPDEPEVTLEANPTDAERFEGFADAGVNRLSLGVQSLDDGELAFLGRNHDSASARAAIAAATTHFPRVSVDLIYALPGQAPAAWATALAEVTAMGVEHLSPYQLTIEPGTAFHRAVRRQLFAPPPDDLAATLFETTQAVLADLGFEAYEVSNHARGPAARSRHNLIYWRGEDYAGVGPGAHGRWTLPDGRHAAETPRGAQDYIARVGNEGLAASLEWLSAREAAVERLLMGLRTDEGVAAADIAPLAIPPARFAELEGLVRLANGRLTATARGRPVLDRVIAELADAA